MDKERMIDDIVAMLDGSVAKGVGHLSVQVDAADDENIERSVETMGCSDCARGNLACNVPTLHEGIDK